MNRDRIRLSRRHQAWIYSAFGVLFLSGAVWLVFHFFMHRQGEFGETTHPAEPWAMKVHGAAAMLVLVVLGTLLPGHVRRGWNLGKNRTSGGGLLILNGVLILSGYALYYFGGEGVRPVISAVHWIVGLLSPFAIAWHVRKGRKLRKLDGARL